ncbi:hypothetical protein HDU76_014100 [Blyttiomyces sp. JEL0837]|nr:hypothetical protein HDU76_014100 [Blyttiomyces sp. JEL0837]
MLKPVMDPMDPRNSVKEADVLRLVTAASRIPSKVTPELKMKVLKGMGEDGLQTVACISAFIGWTNAITDSVGMELGVNDILFAGEQIGPSGWKGTRHMPEGFTNDFENPDLDPNQIRQAIREEVIPKKGLSRLKDYNQILKQIHAIEKMEAPWVKHIPSSHKQIDEWGRDEADVCVGDEVCEWSNGAKALMLYVYATSTGNLLLRGHAAFLATRRQVPISILYGASLNHPLKNPRLDAALDFFRAAASLKRTFPASLNYRLLDTMVSPKGVMEMVATLGLCNMLHRLSAIVAPEPVMFEKEVREFLGTVGSVIGLDPEDAGPQGKDERMVVDPLQFLY